MKLLRELQEEVKFVAECSDKSSGKKDYWIHGPFLQAEIKNRNGRLYPIDVMRKEINFYNEHFVKQNRAFGELGHPDGPTVNLERASHIIKELKEDKNNFIGRAKIIDTPHGRIVKALIDEGARLGVSSRGLGVIDDRNGTKYIREFKIATAADIVSDPSGPDCFVSGLMEGKEWVFENGIWKEAELMATKKILKNASSNELQEAKINAFKKFLGEF